MSSKRKKIRYDCTENDNHLIFVPDDGDVDEIGEVWVGDGAERSHTVIGMKDLLAAIDKFRGGETDRLSKLERDVELLREWVELKERLSELDKKQPKYVPYPVYVPQRPYRPNYPDVTYWGGMRGVNVWGAGL